MRRTAASIAAAVLIATCGALVFAGRTFADGPEEARARTVLQVAAPLSQTASEGGTVTLTARLSGQDGTPFGGERVVFLELSTVFGERLMELGEAFTDATGTAALVIEPAWPGEHSIIARYGGGERREAAQATLLVRTTAPPHIHENAEFGLEQPRRWAPLGFGLLVLAVWGVLGLVVVRVALGVMADAPVPRTLPVLALSHPSLRAASLVPLLPVLTLAGLVVLPLGWFLVAGDDSAYEPAVLGATRDGTAPPDPSVFPATLVRSVSAITTDTHGDITRDSADFPSDLALLDDRVLVLDSNKGRVLTVTAEGKFARTFESNRGGDTSLLRAVAMTTHGGLLYIAAPLFGNVVVLDPSGRVERVVEARVPAGTRPFRPAGIAVDELDNIWLSDSSNHRVVRITPGGSLLASIGDDVLDTPAGLTIDGDGNIWVVDTGRHEVQRYSPAGALLATIGTTRLKSPEAVAIDQRQTVFVSDAGLRAVAVFAPDGAFLGSITGQSESMAGMTGSMLQYPQGIEVESERLYVVDRLSGLFVFQLPSLIASTNER